MKRMYEGKAKIVYQSDDPETVHIEYKDEATAGNGAMRGVIARKGPMNRDITVQLMRVVEAAGVPTHLLTEVGDRFILARKLRMIPLEVVVRNRIAGSLARRLGLAEGAPLPEPIVEFYYKSDELGDPLIVPAHAPLLGVDLETVRALEELALRVNAALAPFLLDRGIVLVDFKLEFGRDAEGTIRLGDEISPDTCRFWDAATNEKLDKDRFRRGLGGEAEAYAEVLRRIAAPRPGA
ncbi:MAG: phosphoribosylaminoimidazolesuccinocarboxamide synthase [Clostridia bacterium]|nr:phosphoribosylaminoimidazolesuccinocarboxamide synthase [Clostridia bacterium]